MADVPTKILKVTGTFGSYGENGKDGVDGVDGATFTPSVSEDGTLSWTNDKGLDNPPPVNIKGGSDNSLGITGATVGQIVKITAVNDSGIPTAWNAVDGADEEAVLLAETDELTENSTSIGITGLNLTKKNYVFRLTGTQTNIGNGLDIVINGEKCWNYTSTGSDVFIGFGLLNGKWIVKIYTENILSRSFRQVVLNFSGVLNSVELKPHYASDTCYINSGCKLMIYSGLFDAVLLAE